MKLLFQLIFWLCLGFLASCSLVPTTEYPMSTQRVITKANQSGLVLHRYSTSAFILTAFERLPLTPSLPKNIHIYIEGDGNSWKTKYKLSDNPTPRQPLALALALQDPHPYVVYLARPCQYTPLLLDPNCTAKYWSSHRYAPEVIQSTSEVLNQIHHKMHNSHFVLIGFSGGASVAALLAAERKDISKLITVAGDLDHDALNDYHRTTPLRGSLNPINIAAQLYLLPQQHWSGDRDRIVPLWVAETFVQRVNHSNCAEIHILKGAGHQKGWKEAWGKILNTSMPNCKS